MINRVLIRIKVVQMLYSYLLTEKLFTLETQPTPPTKEKRYAYKLYLDMLALMVKLSDSVSLRGGHTPLADNRFIKAIKADEKVRTLLVRSEREELPLLSATVVRRLSEAIKESAIFRDYSKESESDMSADLKVWRNLFKTVIVVDPLLSSRFEEEENASARGVERMQEMMEETFVNFSSSQAFIADALKSLKLSLDKARELYFRLLLLPVELTRLQEQNLDAARHKYIVTDEDLNPNMRFVDNQMVEALTNQADFMDEVEDGKLTWLTDNRMLLSALLKKITASNIYKEYMSAPTTDFKADCRLWRDLFKNVILPSEDLAEALEDKSVYWNDDIDTIGTFVLKTFRRLEEGVDQPILPQYKDAEDARFGEELFRAVVKNKEEYRALINDAIHTDSWDTERLAFMDVVIALTAIAELLNFPKIPVVVTVNEYIEMAKSYSTPKSGFFINGVVGGVIKRLQEEGKLNKAN